MSIAYFEIHAEDLRRARSFYGTVFGWSFEPATGLPIEYWRIITGHIRGGLLKRPTNALPAVSGANAFVCSLEVTDFDRWAARIIAAGGQIALPKFPVPGLCWQGYFLDTEGNTFGLFQPDPGAG